MGEITDTIYTTYAMDLKITPGIIKIIADAERVSVTPIEERMEAMRSHYEEIKALQIIPKEKPVSRLSGIYSRLVEIVSRYF